MANIGMMDAAFFVGKNELLSWLNDLLSINYTKVEQCANGAAFCQIMDAIYPGEVPMKKVLFEAKLEHDFVKNYKVLQTVFDKKQIPKHIEVNKLIKAKPLDNLEFLQWIKRYFDLHYGGHDYSAVDRRGGPAKENASGNVKSTGASKTTVKSGAVRVTAKDGAATVGGTSRPSSSAAAAKRAADDGEVTRLASELTSLKLTVAELEKERDFYFAKLRDVEIACQTNEKEVVTELVEEIQKILYATSEDNLDPVAEPLPAEAAAVTA